MERERLVAYDTGFDRIAYQKSKERETLNAYTKKQLETHLGERFNVLLSPTRYEIKNGQIYGENTAEPFINSIKRGRDYRRLHGNPVDFEREDAEVTGFEKIEKYLTDKDVTTGRMMLSVSAKGGKDSIYQHNFYDIFTLKQDEKGKYIEANRYSSGLSINETVDKLKQGMLLYTEEAPSAENLLANPLEINNPLFKTADDVHKFLHKEHKYTKREDFDEGLGAIGFLITSYVNTLAENGSEDEINISLRRVVNGLDLVMGESTLNSQSLGSMDIKQNLISLEFMDFLGKQPVRPVMTGCGFSGDSSSMLGGFIPGQKEAPFSVSHFSGLKDKYGDRNFNCPTCGLKNIRPENQLIDKCQHCKSSKVAC